MKLFIVTVYIRYQEGGRILGVFSTRELAQAAIDALKPTERENEQGIHEVTLDVTLTGDDRIAV